LEQAGLILRRDCQFHWFNRGYESFDAFLATFTAEKRKKAKRERRRVAEAGIEFDTRLGGEMTMRCGTPCTNSMPTPSIVTATSRT
jgi:predicted N-acyltransferase